MVLEKVSGLEPGGLEDNDTEEEELDLEWPREVFGLDDLLFCCW